MTSVGRSVWWGSRAPAAISAACSGCRKRAYRKNEWIAASRDVAGAGAVAAVVSRGDRGTRRSVGASRSSSSSFDGGLPVCSLQRMRAAAGTCRGRTAIVCGLASRWRISRSVKNACERRRERGHEQSLQVALEPLGRERRAAPARRADTSSVEAGLDVPQVRREQRQPGLHIDAGAIPVKQRAAPRKRGAYAEFRITAIWWTAELCALFDCFGW